MLAGVLTPETCNIYVKKNTNINMLSIVAGLNSELSGFDNSILLLLYNGFSYSEAKNAIQDIELFSELGDKFYLPVKSYSSGMRSRLGFSIAMESRSDLYLIDEVLAVGDSKFKIKAKTALMEKIKKGSSSIIVSHKRKNLDELCSDIISI